MKHVWKLVNNMNLKVEHKNKVYIALNILINMLLGLVIWLLVGKMFFEGYMWMICFIGYPSVLVGLIGSITYLYNHEFI